MNQAKIANELSYGLGTNTGRLSEYSFASLYYAPAENQFLVVPLERVRKMKPQVQRLLGYGVTEPGVGFMNYQDPMRLFVWG